MTSKKTCIVHPKRCSLIEPHVTPLNSNMSNNFLSNLDLQNCTVTRKPENCELSRSWFLTMQNAAIKPIQVEFSIPSSLYRSLISPKKNLIDTMMKECGRFNIYFSKRKSNLQKVVIRGPSENIVKVKKKFLQLMEEEKAKNYSVAVPVKSKYHRFLKNKNGGNLPDTCVKLGARAVFPSLKSKNQDLVTIIGKEEAVKEVQKVLDLLLKDLEYVVEDSILINRKFHHYFIMRREQLIREMTEVYAGMMINFTYEGKQSIRVTMKGEKACVEAAKKHIQQIFEPLGSHVTTQYVIPQKFYTFFMGPLCSKVQQIARDFQVQLAFPDKEKPTMYVHPVSQETEKEKWGKSTKQLVFSNQRKNKTILISGQMENCKAAMNALEYLIPFTAEVQVPSHLHPYIIGHNGSGIKKIMSEFDVHMQVSQHAGNFDIVYIMGLAAKVKQTKIKLEKQINDLETEIEERALRNFKLMFTLDAKYHSMITGHKGLFIAQICKDHDVNIQFPKKSNREIQDQITITGYKKNTLSAKDAIMRMLHKIEKTVSREIPINHQVRDNIFGFGGKLINKINQQFQVDIRLPPKGSWNTNVTVIGLLDNVQEAIDHILDLEKYYLSAIRNYDPLLESLKNTCLYKITMESPKSAGKKDGPHSTKPTPNSQNNDSEDFPKLKQQTLPKTHPWRP
uniref:LOW QUALITY PROTEIN: vigilin-like n=1 Tax=Arvicanthis niloticus TaxID=61156 RepID=UPI00148683E6|nr:LOW QUALITY PROTEIN: vigilin-like [Arvicanthis niloticus]